MKRDSERSHCNAKTMPVPVSDNCPKCGCDVERWSDEEETPCPSCGWKVSKGEGPCSEKAGLLSPDIS